MNMKLLDLCCGAGGASVGYNRAGFDVVGVDILPQKNYPFEFIQEDAFYYVSKYGHLYDLIHVSPPCQGYSTMTPDKSKHIRSIGRFREAIKATSKPYIIENVAGARKFMKNPLMLCGTMFDLLVIRHRYFECSPTIWFAPKSCSHYRKVVPAGRRPDRENHYAAIYGRFSDVEFGRVAMGIDWMLRDELRDAIPPAFTEWIGREFRKVIRCP